MKFEKNLLFTFNGKFLYKEKKLNTKIGIAFLFSFVLSFSMICCKKAFAESPFSFGYHYSTRGGIYTDTRTPELLPKEPNLKPITSKEINIANRQYYGDENYHPPYAGLRRGISNSINVLGLVELGDAGIKEAAKNGNISKIQFIDTKREKLYVFYEKLTTVVYGE